MKKLLLTIFFLSFLFNSSGEELKDILNLVQEKLKKVETYKADFILKFNTPQGEVLMNGEIIFKREDKLKMEMKIPNIPYAQQFTYSDGNLMWQYLPYQNMAFKINLLQLKKEMGDFYYPHSKEDISKPLKEAELSSIVYLGKEIIEGREYFVLKAEAKPEAIRDIPFSWLKVWIDTEWGLEKKAVFYDNEDREVFVRDFENISVNLPISDTEFSFSPPEGVEIIDMTEKTREELKKETLAE